MKNLKYVNCTDAVLKVYSQFIKWFIENVKDNLYTCPKNIIVKQNENELSFILDRYNFISLNPQLAKNCNFYKAITVDEDDNKKPFLLALDCLESDPGLITNPVDLFGRVSKQNVTYVPIFGCKILEGEIWKQDHNQLDALLEVLKFHSLIKKPILEPELAALID